MANEQNLIPNSERTPSELREQTRKAGIASGKARKRKADLRRMAQEVLDGTYTDKNGNQFTGEEAVIKGLIANLTDPKGKNWGKAMDLLIQLIGANKSKEEKQLMKTQIKILQTKADLMTGADTSALDHLDEILKEMRKNAEAQSETE